MCYSSSLFCSFPHLPPHPLLPSSSFITHPLFPVFLLLSPLSLSDVRAPQGAVVTVSQFHLVFIVHPASLIHYK